jgi:hypothetical protein
LSIDSYILNVKGISYKTEWLDLPDITDAVMKLDVEPSTLCGDVPVYTVSTNYDQNTRHAVTDSQAIAYYLDE